MKKILLVGKQLNNIPPAEQLSIRDASYFAAPGLTEVRDIFEQNNNEIDIVIMGAGIELEKRLEIVRYVFNTSDTTSVHMKDYASGPEGFLPFINGVLGGLIPAH